MTEEQIERAIEKKVDALDAEFIPSGPRVGTMSQEEYDRRLAEIDKWGEDQRRTMTRGC